MTLTSYIIIATIVLLLAYDGICGKLNAPTESRVLRDWGWKYNSMPLCAGILCGHWYGNTMHVDYTAWGFAAPVIIGYVAWDLLLAKLTPERLTAWYRWPLFHVLIGIVVGMFCWGQTHAGAFF